MERLINESASSTTVSELCAEYRANNQITKDEYELYHVKRGLRNRDGTGVMAGLTHVCNVHGYLISDGVKIPDSGRLTYRSMNVVDIITMTMIMNVAVDIITIMQMKFSIVSDLILLKNIMKLSMICYVCIFSFLKHYLLLNLVFWHNLLYFLYRFSVH